VKTAIGIWISAVPASRTRQLLNRSKFRSFPETILLGKRTKNNADEANSVLSSIPENFNKIGKEQNQIIARSAIIDLTLVPLRWILGKEILISCLSG
jgi:hypothetical protein